ncbi:MAG: phosphate ABC transporter substrate-binding protein [Anaerolineae bacterium]|nr:phosphate ABC transporter substrate-binding protein [Anaerolineae bacterium]MDW7992625.1 phosphate ABC transporter substrate-binding protein [Anaerolineae bacterium]
MKKVWALIGLMLLLSSCRSVPSTPVSPPVAGKLVFAGSTTMQPLVGALGEAFQKRYPGVQLEIAAGGSKVGIQAVHEGTVDIGMASRNLTPQEAEGISVHTIALDVIAVVVHPSNPVENLSLNDLAAIYWGEIVNWRQVGGPDLAVVPVVREISSGTRGAFDELVLGGREPTAPNLQTGVTAGDVAAMVAERPGAIGYVGFGNLTDQLRVVKINGVAPTPATARSGEYPLVRPLNLLTGPLSQPLAEEFIRFALSPDGQRIVEQAGWVPVR